MVFSEEDKALIKNLHLIKGYGSRRLLAVFPSKHWSKGGLDYLLGKLHNTGSTDRKTGSGRPRSARSNDNVKSVEELVLSQDDKPKSHFSTRQISRQIGVTQSSVVRIIHRDLGLKCLKR